MTDTNEGKKWFVQLFDVTCENGCKLGYDRLPKHDALGHASRQFGMEEQDFQPADCHKCGKKMQVVESTQKKTEKIAPGTVVAKFTGRAPSVSGSGTHSGVIFGVLQSMGEKTAKIFMNQMGQKGFFGRADQIEVTGLIVMTDAIAAQIRIHEASVDEEYKTLKLIQAQAAERLARSLAGVKATAGVQ